MPQQSSWAERNRPPAPTTPSTTTLRTSTWADKNRPKPTITTTNKLRTPTWGDTAITTGLRVVPSVAGGIIGSGFAPVLGTAIGGGIGAGAGEAAAEWYEKAFGLREKINPLQIGTQTAIGAIPLGGKMPGAGATAEELLKFGLRAPVTGAIKGAAVNTAAAVPTQLAETGELPTWNQLGSAAETGAYFGMGTGALLHSVPAMRRVKSVSSDVPLGEPFTPGAASPIDTNFRQGAKSPIAPFPKRIIGRDSDPFGAGPGEQRALPPSSIPPGLSGDTFTADPSGTVVPPISRTNPSNLASRFGINTPEALETLRGNELERPTTTIPFGDPFKANALAPIESLPKVDTSVVQTQVNILPDVTQPKPVGGTVVGTKINKPVTRLPSAPVIPRPVPPVVAQSPVVQQPPIPQAPITQPQLPPVQQPVVQQPGINMSQVDQLLERGHRLADVQDLTRGAAQDLINSNVKGTAIARPVDTSVVKEPVAQLPAVSQPVNITPAEKAAGIAWNKEGNNYRSGEFHIVPDTKISNKTGADQRVRKTGSWTLYHNDKPISYGSLAKVKNKAVDYATKGPAVEAVEPVVEPVKEAPTKMAKGTFVEDKPVRKPGLALEPFEGRNGPSIGVWENNEKGGGSSLGQVEPRNDKFRARVEDKDLGLFDTQQDAVNAVLNQTGRRHLIPKETGIDTSVVKEPVRELPAVESPRQFGSRPEDAQLSPYGPETPENTEFPDLKPGEEAPIVSFPAKGTPGSEGVTYLSDLPPMDGNPNVARAIDLPPKAREQQTGMKLAEKPEITVASPKIQRAWTQAIRDEMSTGVSLEKARENVYKRAPGFAEDARVNPKKFIEHAKNQLVNKAEVAPREKAVERVVEKPTESTSTEIAKTETPTSLASPEQINKLLEKGYKPSSLQGLSPTEADKLIRQRYNPDFDFPDDVAPEGSIEPVGNVTEHEKLTKTANDFIKNAESLLNDFKFRNPNTIDWLKEWPGNARNIKEARYELDQVIDARNRAVKQLETYNKKLGITTAGAVRAESISPRSKEVGLLWKQMHVDPVVSALTKRESVFLDAGGRLTPSELDYIKNSSTVRYTQVLIDEMFNAITESLGIPQVSNRLQRTGLLMHRHGPNLATYGYHIPNTNLSNSKEASAIVINMFEHVRNFGPKEAARRMVVTGWHETAHIGEGVPDKNIHLNLSADDLRDPTNGEYFLTYVNQVINQGLLDPSTGHGTDFLQRLGEIYVKTGPKLFNHFVDQFHGIFTGGQFSNNYSPEVQKLLQIYEGSRGRGSTVPDTLSGKATQPSNQRSGGTGHISSIDKADGDGVPYASQERIDKPKYVKDENIKKLEREIDIARRGIDKEGVPTKQNWAGKPRTVKVGKSLSPAERIADEERRSENKFGTESSRKLDYTEEPNLPSAPKGEEPKRPLHERMGIEDNKFDRIARDIKTIDPKTGEPASARRAMELQEEERKAAAAVEAAKKAKADEAKAKRDAAKEAKRDKVKDARNEKAKKTVDEIIADKVAKNPVLKTPTFKGAIKALPERFRNSDLHRAVYEDNAVSSLTKLKKLGPAGEALAKLMRDERTATNQAYGKEVLKTRKAERSLTKKERLEVADIMDGSKPVSQASSQAVKDAYTSLRESTEYQGNRAVAADVKMKDSRGRTVPFEKLKGEYWPRIYPEDLYKDPKTLAEKLLKAGNSPATVDAMLKRIKDKGERFSSAQHTRDFNLPGYRKDLGALRQHQYEMARAITRAERYGPLDVSDSGSVISRLINKTSDPVKAKNIVNDYLNRIDVEDAPQHKAQERIYRLVVGAEAATKLSQFGITNMGDLANLASNLGVRNTMKAMAKTIWDPHGSADIAVQTGSHAIIDKELHDAVGRGELLGKAYGATTTEKFIRTVGALVGRMNVQDLFNKAKKNPKYAKPLAEFVDGRVEDVLKQDKLTPEQIDFGGGRGVEVTSGIPDKLTLPKRAFAKNAMARLPFLLKRFAFVNTRNIVDAVNRQPTTAAKIGKATAILLAYGVAGEGIGDIKAAIKGLVSGDIGKAIEERGDYIGINPVFDRIMADYLQSALFGLVGDVSESIARKHMGKITGTVGGPVGADLDELAYDTGVALWPGPEQKKDRFKPFKESILTRIPYIGAGLEERYKKRDLKGLPTMKTNSQSMPTPY